MKKLVFTLGLAAMAFGMSSCKGDYGCTCNWTVSGSDTTFTAHYVNIGKSDAEETCDLAEISYQSVDPTVTCTLAKE